MGALMQIKPQEMAGVKNNMVAWQQQIQRTGDKVRVLS